MHQGRLPLRPNHSDVVSPCPASDHRASPYGWYLLENGWLLGKAEKYNRELAMYPEDLLAFVKETQDSQWQKYCKISPDNPEEKLLEKVAAQL